MEFGLSESQQMLKDNARKFFAGECPMEEVRRLMETDTAYDEALWAKMAEQGYTGIIFPEEYGGVGLGKVELILLMEEAGGALLPGPFFSTVALAGAALDAMATPEQKKRYLAPICSGEARSTVAILEDAASWNVADVRMASANGELTGEKLFVPDAAIANFMIVVARDGVFVVDAKARGDRCRTDGGHGSDAQTVLGAIQSHALGKAGQRRRPGAGSRHCRHGSGCGNGGRHAANARHHR